MPDYFPGGCEYGDSKPDVCQAQVTAGTIKSYCLNNKDDCCETCSSLQNSTDPSTLSIKKFGTLSFP